MFVIILTAVDKYSLLNRDKFRQRIPTQLFQKQKLFSEFVKAFFKYRFNFQHC